MTITYVSGTSAGLVAGSGDEIIVTSGGAITTTTIGDGGSLVVDAMGTATDTTLVGSALASLYGMDEHTVIGSGGSATVGGQSTDTVIEAGGELDVYSGGVATNTTVQSGGTQLTFEDGALISGGTVQSGGDSELIQGASTNLTLSGGQQIIQEGIATGTIAVAGGTMLLNPGPVEIAAVGTPLGPILTSNAVISSGGTEIANSLVGAEEFLNPDGSLAYSEVISGGSVTLTYGNVFASDGTNLSGDTQVYTQSGSAVMETETFQGMSSSTTDDNAQIAPVGSAVGTHVLSGGTFVFYGAAVQNLTVDPGGTEIIGGTVTLGGSTLQQSGIVVAGNHVSNGVLEIVSSGGQDLYGVIQVGAEEDIQSGGLASGTQVFYAAEQQLLGGTTTGTTVSSGGDQVVGAGGTASATILKSGSTEIVESGGTAIGNQIVAAATLNVSSGGTASAMQVDVLSQSNGVAAGPAMIVFSGGTAVGTIINDGEVDVFGLASNTTVSLTNHALGETATLVVKGTSVDPSGTYAPGLATSTTVIGQGASLVAYDATIISTYVSGGVFLASSGVTASGTILVAGGLIGEENFTSAYSTMVSSGGTEFVSLESESFNTVVSSGGVQSISGVNTNPSIIENQPAVTMGATILNGGEQLVGDFGKVYHTTISSGGSSIVLDAGSATESIVDGSEIISANGISLYATINAGGTLTVSSGGGATGTAIGDGGTATISAGGSAGLETVSSGGLERVYGTTNSAIVLDGGRQNVLSGGVATGTLVFAGGTDTISARGTAIGATVDTGGDETVLSGGVADVTTVQLAATQIVSAGGYASGTIVTGGTQTVQAGAAVAATTVSINGLVLVSGAATQSIVDGDGTVKVANGGTTSRTQVNDGGLEIVLAGGSAVSTTINDGGAQGVSAGGTAIDATIGAGGLERVASGGVSIDPIVLGTLIDENGDPTVGAVIESGGVEVVAPGASATGTTVESGGTLIVLPGALAAATVVQPGGAVISAGDVVLQQPGSATQVASVLSGIELASGTREFILSGATAAATTIDAGATETVYAGGITSGSLINGGTLDLADGTRAIGPLGFGANGGTLQVDDLTPLVTSVAGFTTGDTIDLTALAYQTGGTATLGTGDVLTIVEGGATDTVQLAGAYTGEPFQLAADAGAGTMVVVDTVPCFCRGTHILTEAGEVLVEALTIGTGVVTASGAVHPIRWIGRRSYAGAFAARNPDVLPVILRAGSLGGGLPRRDLWVSPLHALFVDGALIPARLLVNGVSIVQAERVERVEYFHIELDGHDLLLAEGAPAESFIDDHSRGMFHNAAEYRMLYPVAALVPAQYCAPRLEDGEALAEVQRRLALLACPVPEPRLRGYLNTVDRDRVTGWARNLDLPGARVLLQVIVDRAVLGVVLANEARPDLRAAGEGDGSHAFNFTIPGGLSPHTRHVLEVRFVADNTALPNSPWTLEPMPLLLPPPSVPAAPFAGVLDQCGRDRLTGWAWEPGTEAPVALVILDNGLPLARILANLNRPDLRPAGIGNGRHCFDVTIPGGLSPLARHVLEIRREADGAALPGTPVVIEAATSFDPALEAAVTRAIAATHAEGEHQRVLSFLLTQTERMLQLQATAAGGAEQRLLLQQFRRRWGPESDGMAERPRDPGRRALVIDGPLPARGRDAGSEAVLSHMRALQALGYEVSVVGADELAGFDAGLAAEGVTCLGLPSYASVEDVLRRQAGCFDLVYLHRVSVASRYLQLVRKYVPRARVVYSVADLHHVRLARQAAAEDRPELLAASRATRLLECTAAWSADLVITHSVEEAAELRRAVPGARVHVVPWAVPVAPASARRRPRFMDRSGVAFIGHGIHAPNVDAARWLVEDIMPLVWQTDPTIGCVLVGSALPEAVRALAGPGVTVLGHVPDLQSVFDRVRLSIAPLRFGAGVKGKVLTSLAARTPCVLTPVAAEGLILPAPLRHLVGRDAAELAALIVRVHGNRALSQAAGKAGAELVQRTCSEASVLTALEQAIGERSAGIKWSTA